MAGDSGTPTTEGGFFREDGSGWKPDPLPSQRPPSAPKAPRPLRLKSQQAVTTLPPGAHALVDSLVGTFYGSTRSEVLRFIVVSWLHSGLPAVSQVLKDKT